MADIGWMAFGIGSSMVTADMLIVWPQSSGNTWTKSVRSATSHVMPTLQPSQPTPEDLAFLPAFGSSNASSTTVSLLRVLSPSYASSASGGNKLVPGRLNQLVYAYSGTRPSSDSEDAALVQHSDFGTTSLDLSKVITVPSSNSGSSGNGDSSGQQEGGQAGGEVSSVTDSNNDAVKRRRIIIAHAAIGSVTWMLVSPLAVLLAAWGRRYRHWVKLHQVSGLGIARFIVFSCQLFISP